MSASEISIPCNIEKDLLRLFSISEHRFALAEAKFASSPCLHQLSILVQIQLEEQKKPDPHAISRCQIAASQILPRICYIATWLYRYLVPELLEKYFSNNEWPCPQGKRSDLRQRLIASMILFMEWRVRPYLFPPIKKEICRAKTELEQIWYSISQDPDIVFFHTKASKLLQEVDCPAQSTYNRYEKLVIQCLVAAIKNKCQICSVVLQQQNSEVHYST